MSIVSDIIGGIVGGATQGAAAATPTGAVSAVANVAGKVIDWLHPDPAVKAEIELKLKSQEGEQFLKELATIAQVDMGQLAVNQEEAKSESFWKAGWRPGAGWTCVGGLAYQVFLSPLLGWVATNLWGWSPPPVLAMDTLLTLLMGMLGFGAYRMVEKRNGTA